MPRNLLRDLTSVGTGMSRMARTLSGSGTIPFPVRMWPINGTCERRSLIFCGFKVKFNLRHRSSRARRFPSWLLTASSMVTPNPQTRKSSAITSMPWRPSIASFILRCQISGAELIPKGILSHLKRPNGVLKVV